MGVLSCCFVWYDMKMFEDALVDCETAHGANPSEDNTYLTALLYRKLGQQFSVLPLLEGAIARPSNRAASTDCWPRSTSRTVDQVTRATSGRRGSASSRRTRA